MRFVLRAGTLLSTTLTLASAARTMPGALVGARSLFRAPVARTLSALALMSTPGEPRRQREIDVRGFMVPLVNDVVRYPSKWPGEYLLGAVDYVQVLPEDRGYTVDVRPLRSVGGERWESKRGTKLVQEDAGRLRVVAEAVYDARADAWTVPEAVTMGLFSRAKPRPPDPERTATGLFEYEQLKWRLVREAAIVSAVGVVANLALGGSDQAVAYGLGATAGIAYLGLLARTVDTLGGGGLGEKLAFLRLGAPIAPFVLYAAWRYLPLHALGGASPPALFDAAGGGGFLASGLIPREQFIAMAVGVLTHRLPLLVREAQAIAQAGAQEVGRTVTEPRGGGSASLPTTGSLVAGAQLLAGASKAADAAKAAAQAREAEARAADGRRRPIVLCGPSAVGKTTLIRRLLAELGAGLAFVVSTTTRAPRPGEVDGVDYRFVTAAAFESAVAAGGFVEWVQGADGTYYGTAKKDLLKVGEESGRAALLDVDVKGAEAVYSIPGLDPVCIFVSPPSLQALEARLKARGTESAAEMAYRMRRASSEIEAAATLRIFEHYLINSDVDETYAELKRIVLDSNRWLAPYDAPGGGGDAAAPGA